MPGAVLYLLPLKFGAGDRDRTGDIQLGKTAVNWKQAVGFGIDGRELLEFGFTVGEPRHNAPAHHHQFALTGLASSPDNGLAEGLMGIRETGLELN